MIENDISSDLRKILAKFNKGEEKWIFSFFFLRGGVGERGSVRQAAFSHAINN